MVILGLGFTDHDASAALVIDGELKSAIARERLTRRKRDGRLCGTGKLDLSPAILYCLDVHGLTSSDLDLVVWNQVDHWSAAKTSALLALEGSVGFSRTPILVLPHHFAHACCAYYLSPFSDAAILVADGSGGSIGGLQQNCGGPEPESIRNGEVFVQHLQEGLLDTARELESFYYCDGYKWTPLRKVCGGWSDGIGSRYGAVSQLLFGDPLDAGKTMGLAPYGNSKGHPVLLEMMGPVEASVFKATKDTKWRALKRELKEWRRAAELPNYEDRLASDTAAAIQRETEEALLSHARWLRQRTNATNLCFAGGVALNCVANSYLAREAGFDDVFVPPAPADDGISVGCALYGAALHGELHRGSCPVFLGRGYSHNPRELELMGLTLVSTGPAINDWISRKLADGAVVAWFQGGAELGPRALGHRSLLADPRRPEMRDFLNKIVKQREAFRPFAPVVLEHAVPDYFEEHHSSYFMSFVARIRSEKQVLLPAITHVDGTARYQVLRRCDNLELYELVSAFARHTGIPMLLNTSFNRAGEPIVETPQEAVRCMLAASVPYLVMDGAVYRRTETLR